jgi:release factor glutamine methyltransferase
MKYNPSHYKDQLSILSQKNVQNPSKDFELFCSYYGDALTDEMIHDFFLRRGNREPIERILGQSIFRGSRLILRSHIFKPGFETETTIDYALQYLEAIPHPRILDLGTGCGCILISLLKENPTATGMGIDVNEDILTIAKQNAINNDVNDRAQFFVSNWGDTINEEFDLFISNPPRIPTHKIPELVTEVSKFDPKIALDGGKTGIEFYLKTVQLMRRIGSPNALAIIQVGDIILSPAIKAIKTLGYKNITIGRDYKYSTNCLIISNTDYKLKSSLMDTIKSLLRIKS